MNKRINQLEEELRAIEDARKKAWDDGDQDLFDKLGEEGYKIEQAIDDLTEHDLHDLQSDPESLFNL